VPRGGARDEGRPLKVGLQEQALNHLKLRWLRAFVVSVEVKRHVCEHVRCGPRRRIQVNHRRGVETPKTTLKPGSPPVSGIRPEDTCLLSGRRPAYRWRELGPGSCAERGNLSP
jgi:hypothetical protein